MLSENPKILIVSGGDGESRRALQRAARQDALFIGGPLPVEKLEESDGCRRFLLTGEAAGDIQIAGEVLDGVCWRHSGDETADCPAGVVGSVAANAVRIGFGSLLLSDRLGLRFREPAIPSGIVQDDLGAALVLAIGLGYRELGLIDLDRPNDLLGRTAGAWDAQIPAAQLDGFARLRAALFETDHAVTVTTLNQACPIAAAGLAWSGSAREFTGQCRLSAVFCPLTSREVHRAAANLALWQQPEFSPYLVPPARPELDLVFVFNCSEDPSLAEPLQRAFAGSPLLQRMFRRVEVEFLGLSGEDDRYVRDAQGPVPRYGYKAGPNLLFFGALRRMRPYPGFAFLMETDCVPLRPGWAQSLDRLCRSRPSSWIIGSLYRGLGLLGNNIKRHINGNALYAVGNERFWDFLDSGYMNWLARQIAEHEPDLAFDTAWERFIEAASAEIPDNSAWRILQETYQKFVFCDEIVNIAGWPEQTRSVVWTLPALRQAFPSAVVAHGPVGDEARNLDQASYSNALARFAEEQLLSAAGNGLKFDRWISEGASRAEGQFRWRLPGRAESSRVGFIFRRAQGGMPAGAKIRARCALSSSHPAFIRVLLQSGNSMWDRAAQEAKLAGSGENEEVEIEFELTRDTEHCLFTVDYLADSSGDALDLGLEQVELQFESRQGGTLSLSLSADRLAPLAYGARSAIGPRSFQVEPASSSIAPSVETERTAAAAEEKPSVDGKAPDGSDRGPVESAAALGLRYQVRVTPTDSRFLHFERLGRVGDAIRIADIEIEDGNVVAVRLGDCPPPDDRQSDRSQENQLVVSVPKGRRSLIEFLKSTHAENGAKPVSPEIRSTAEELVCCWTHLEHLATSLMRDDHPTVLECVV